MWADAQHDGRAAEYRWHSLQKFCNSIPCMADPAVRVPCSNAANIGDCKTWTQSEICT